MITRHIASGSIGRTLLSTGAIAVAFFLTAGAALADPCPESGGVSYGIGKGRKTTNSMIALAPASNTVCFLNYVSGQFHGSGESVYIAKTAQVWFLIMQAGSTGVEAYASCYDKYSGYSVSNEAVWSQPAGHLNNQLIDIGPTGYQHCFLTRMSGHFQGGGESIRIVDQMSGGVMHHYITGTAGAPGLAIVGGARCYGPESSYEWNYSASQYGPTYVKLPGYAGTGDVCNMGLTNQNPNGLTAVSGKFEGWGESVGVVVSNSQWWASCGGGGCSWNYYLYVTSQQQGVSGSVATIPW
jgi:hypothetical protein